MIAKQTTRYILNFNNEKEMEEAEQFAAGVRSFYGVGSNNVSYIHGDNFIIVGYDHYIETKETVFGD